MEFRVRQVISLVNYDKLVKADVIPDIDDFFYDVQSKRYPPWVYAANKKGIDSVFCLMGLYLEAIAKKMISNIPDKHVHWGDSNELELTKDMRDSNKKWKEIILPYFNYLCNLLEVNSNDIATKDQLYKWFGFFGSLNKSVKEWFEQDKPILFNQEYASSNGMITISGHPDIVYGNTVIDVKTTQNFSKMSKESYLQVLSYVALMRSMNIKVRKLGILLPMQLELINVSVRKWDSEKFMRILFKQTEAMIKKQLQIISVGNLGLPNNVGFTMCKDAYIRSSPLKSNSNWSHVLADLIPQESLPIQIMLTGRIGHKVNLTDIELAQINNTIHNYNANIFIHAAYSINLAKPWSKKIPDDKTWGLRGCITALEAGVAMGSKGVVIHTGKPTTEISEKRGYRNLIKNIRKSIKSASRECPLLLETPVGAGTEMGADIKEFSRIYSEFTEEEKQVFKICIDTCHVFCAGYNPYKYVLKWAKLHGPQSIGLIHFNDSRQERGCCKDGHAVYGRGNIGATILSKVAEWCNHHGIKMVTE